MEPLKTFREKRFREILLIGAAALLLLFFVWFVFLNEGSGNSTAGNTYEMTETERRLCAILSEIDGVGEIEAYVSEDGEGNAVSVVLVFEGADSLSVRLDVMRAAASVLGISQNNVLIYKMTT